MDQSFAEICEWLQRKSWTMHIPLRGNPYFARKEPPSAPEPSKEQREASPC